MRPSIYKIIAIVLLWVMCQSASASDQIPPAKVVFFGSGFTVQAPAGASQLELRIVDPNRYPVYSQSSDGGDIHWAMSGAEINGEYRYEAVVVMEIQGQMKQRNAGGGFDLQGGMLIGPPDPVAIESRLRVLEDQN